ncbi:MAG: DUF3842 family protein [Lachnospiraceae bacterium]|nr:DUF3842 family protein [Lachnospiraceae bacterium]
MKIVVIDGQGGGVGKGVIEELIKRVPKAEIIAVGANATATSNMMKGGAINGATGENAVIYNSGRADVIVGPMGIVMANAMLGEITPAMAMAVSSSNARIILIPMNKCHVELVGIENRRLSEYLQEAVDKIIEYGLQLEEQ